MDSKKNQIFSPVFLIYIYGLFLKWKLQTHNFLIFFELEIYLYENLHEIYRNEITFNCIFNELSLKKNPNYAMWRPFLEILG